MRVPEHQQTGGVGAVHSHVLFNPDVDSLLLPVDDERHEVLHSFNTDRFIRHRNEHMLRTVMLLEYILEQ